MRDEIIELLSDLVEIDSVNPALVAGGAGEARIAAFIADWSRRAGLETETLEEEAGRPSVVVRARGAGGGHTLLICGHTDTVNVEGMLDAHVPRLEGDRLYGRGSYDMKAGIAAALIACREASKLGLAGDVVVAAVSDEEHASVGIREVLRTVQADAAILTEPTELEIVIGHQGFVWAEIEVVGRSAHGSRPHLGIDAIVKAGPILTALGALNHALHERTHPLLGRGSIHASLISGGVELSSYAARCVIGLERRTLPGERCADIETELDLILDHCRTLDSELVAERRTLLVRNPFEIPESEEIVSAVAAAVTESAGLRPRISGASYWADTAFIAEAGIPCVLFGPSGAGAHATEEWVSIADTETVAHTLVGVARKICV